MKLIVGLGNPGKNYANSRHNLGFRCVTVFARHQGWEFARQQAKAMVASGEVFGQKVLLAKPKTFMNLSGESVAALMQYYKIGLADLLVIYDDVDLPLGKIRIRENGGSGGHNGIKSIIQHADSQGFARIRVGIGALQGEEPDLSSQASRTPEYVLGHFTSREKVVVEDVCQRVAEAIRCILADGIARAMNKYNSE